MRVRSVERPTFSATGPARWNHPNESVHDRRHLLEEAGFEVVEVHPLAGAWTTFSLELSYALRRYHKGLARPVVGGVMRVALWAAGRWDKVDFQPRFSWSHLAIARRPEA